jgi:RNA polymerase sigma-70 factor (ECF subfamily)
LDRLAAIRDLESSVESIKGYLGPALGGNKEALSELVRRLTPIIQSRTVRVLLRRKGQAAGRDIRQEIEDLVQDVFVALLANDAKVFRSWNPKRGLSLENFIGLVAERQIATILRTGKRNPWKEDPTLADELEKTVELKSSNTMAQLGFAESKTEGRIASKELLQILWERLTEEISPLGRRLFDLLFVREESVEAVCEQLNMNPDSVYAWRSRLSRRARKILAEVMSDNQAPTRRPSIGGGAI